MSSTEKPPHPSITRQYVPVLGVRLREAGQRRDAVAQRSRRKNLKGEIAALEGKIDVLTQWRQGFEGRGVERYASGELYVGDIKHGERDGTGVYHHTNGQVLLSRWRQNEPVGEGVQWSAKLPAFAWPRRYRHCVPRA